MSSLSNENALTRLLKSTGVQSQRREPSMETEEQQAPRTAMPSRRLSDQAAQAAQHVIDLEQEVEILRAQRDIAQNRVVLVEESNKILHDELEKNKFERHAIVDKLSDERDFYKNRCVEIQTKLSVAGNIILDAMQGTPRTGADVYAPPGKIESSVVSGVERALEAHHDPRRGIMSSDVIEAPREEEKVPKFIKRREGNGNKGDIAE